jgi:hypothetical protein
MKDHSNDITECLEAFNKAVDTHKDALKSEPANENIKNTLLQLVNAMNDIAETYYSTAESKKGIECVFRSNRPPIPEHSGHLFQSKSAT